MALKIMADNGVEISAKQDGALYNVALNDQDFIIQGLGNEFAMSYAGLNVSVESGECIIHGRHITADSTNQIALPPNESGYLVIRVDLTQPIGQEGRLFATPTLTHEEINWGGSIYDMPIATFTTQTIEISNFEDVRVIKNTATPPLELKTIGGQSLVGSGDIPFKTFDGMNIFGSGDIKSKFYGFDTNRILAVYIRDYTATEDCYIFGKVGANITLHIDNASYRIEKSDSEVYNGSLVCPLKKGQRFYADDSTYNGECWFNVYGIK